MYYVSRYIVFWLVFLGCAGVRRGLAMRGRLCYPSWPCRRMRYSLVWPSGAETPRHMLTRWCARVTTCSSGKSILYVRCARCAKQVKMVCRFWGAFWGARTCDVLTAVCCCLLLLVHEQDFVPRCLNCVGSRRYAFVTFYLVCCTRRFLERLGSITAPGRENGIDGRACVCCPRGFCHIRGFELQYRPSEISFGQSTCS